MAQDEERIKITFDTNADNVKKSTDGLNTSIERTIEESEKLTSKNKEVKKAQEDTTKTTKDQKAGLESLGGGFGAAIQGAKGLLKQFALMLANPIILALAAIVGAVTLLFKAFTSTKEGGEKLDRVMAGIGAVMDVLRDRVLKVWDILKKLFSGDIIGAAKEYLGLFDGFGDEVVAEFNKAADAVKRLQEVADATRDLSVARAQLNRDLAESKALVEDENAAYEDKVKALKKVREAEGKQTEQELENARKKLKAIQDQNNLSDSSSEALQAEADAKIALFALEQKSADNRKALSLAEKKIDNEESARRKAIADEQRALYKEREDQRKAELKAIEDFNRQIADKEASLLKQLQDLQDETAQQKLDRQKERDLAEIEALRQKGADVTNMLAYNAQIYAEKQAEIDEIERQRKAEKDAEDLRIKQENDQKTLDYQNQIDQAKLQQEKTLQESRIAILDNVGNLLGQLAGKNKALQKAAILVDSAIGIGKSIIETTSSNIATTAQGAALAIPTAGASVAAAAGIVTATNISTGLGISANIAATAKALQAIGAGGSAGSKPNLPTVRGASAQPQTGFQASNENQIATSITNSQIEQPPIKAYVVTSEVTTGQNLDSKLISENSFG